MGLLFAQSMAAARGAEILFVVRAKFARGEELKYLSHLDTMRVFERAARRARLPVKYSEGFNPRPSIVFGLPLAVGVTSDAEYADFGMCNEISSMDFIDRINKQMPAGTRILAAAKRRGNDNIMAQVEAARYEVVLFSKRQDFCTRVKKEFDRMMNSKELIVRKKGKRGTKQVNIRPLILEAETGNVRETVGITERDNLYAIALSLFVSAGSRANLNTRLLIEEIDSNTGLVMLFYKTHRKELYIKKGNGLAVPFDE